MATRSVAGCGGWVRGRAMARPEVEDSSVVAVCVADAVVRCSTGPCPLRIVLGGSLLVGVSAVLPRFGGWFNEH
jgi:hypothetical protein